MLGTRITRRQRCSVKIANATQIIAAACLSNLSQLYIQVTLLRASISLHRISQTRDRHLCVRPLYCLSWMGTSLPVACDISERSYQSPHVGRTFLKRLLTPSEIFSVVPADCLWPALPRMPSIPLSAVSGMVRWAAHTSRETLHSPRASCWPVAPPGATVLVAPWAVASPGADMFV